MDSPKQLHIAVHDSKGLNLVEGYPNHGKHSVEFNSTGRVKFFLTSDDGKKLALIANGSVQILSGDKWQVAHSVEHPTAQELVFSPNGGYLAVWCLYIKAKDGASPTPNLHIYDIRTDCKLQKSFFQISQSDWKPQWTGDDSIMARNVTNEVHFYKAEDLDKMAHKRVQPKLRSFSISPSKSNHVVAFFTPSLKAAPCLVNVFKYPHFKESDRPIANKCFYKVDTVEFLWNKSCTAVLLMASGDSVTTNSYYGEKQTFLLNTKSGDSVKICFDKDGPVHSVTWNPDGKSFMAVYGSNPAKATAFNMKGDPSQDFEEGARNFVMVNPVSNLVLLGGSGNMSPKIEVWDASKVSRICFQEIADLTFIEWSPCGQYILTATCSPRLRVNNGYRIYHYSGSLLFEHLCPSGTELYSAKWLPLPTAAKTFKLSSAKVQGIQSAVKTASTARYIPPGQRAALNSGDKMVETCKQFLRQIDKYDPRSAAAVANKPPPPLSKTAARNLKRKEARKEKEEAEFKAKNSLVIEEPEGFVKKNKGKPKESDVKTVNLTGDGEKRAKNIRKKLNRIDVLKKEQTEGKVLDKQQVTLLDSETELIAQLRTLSV